MSSQETITQFMQSMGIPTAPFSALPGTTGLVGTLADHMGLQVDIQIDRDIFLIAQLVIGYVPKMNVAPSLRHLLSLNSILVGVYFCIFDNNAIVLRASRRMEGLDLMEFKFILDGLCSTYWQHVTSAIQTFQIPQQPT